MDSEAAAARGRFSGSPTVRVDGRDVDRTANETNDYALRCHLYPADSGMRRTPPDIWDHRPLLAAR